MTVNLGLIKLPDEALMFPNLYDDLDFTKPRHARHTSQAFERWESRLFPGIRLHDLRGSHETALLDSGVPVHVVAARCGHDQRSYAKRTKKADTSAANVIQQDVGGSARVNSDQLGTKNGNIQRPFT